MVRGKKKGQSREGREGERENFLLYRLTGMKDLLHLSGRGKKKEIRFFKLLNYFCFLEKVLSVTPLNCFIKLLVQRITLIWFSQLLGQYHYQLAYT